MLIADVTRFRTSPFGIVNDGQTLAVKHCLDNWKDLLIYGGYFDHNLNVVTFMFD